MIYPAWIEIPAQDVERAVTFYKSVLQIEIDEPYDDGTRRVAMLFGGGEGQPGVSLNQTANFEPSRKGTLLYLRVDSPLTPFLERVVAAGGSILEGETAMSPTSTYAIIGDSEGNAVALSYTTGQ